MNLLKFAFYTLIGATMWNEALLALGWYLDSKWETILAYRKPLDAGIVALLVVLVIAWYGLHLRKPKPVETEV